MRPFQSRQFILVLVAFAVGAGSLLVAGSVLAETELFRVEQRWHNFPNPSVTTPGGAGMYQGYLQPYVIPSFYSPPACWSSRFCWRSHLRYSTKYSSSHPTICGPS